MAVTSSYVLYKQLVILIKQSFKIPNIVYSFVFMYKIFPGNSDQNTIVYNRLPEAMTCRYVRLLPVTWKSSISMRMELYGDGPIAGKRAEKIVLYRILRTHLHNNNLNLFFPMNPLTS